MSYNAGFYDFFYFIYRTRTGKEDQGAGEGILKLLMSPGIDSASLSSLCWNFKQSMGARNRVGIGLSYRPAWLPILGAMLTSPCLSWPRTLIPDGSSRPCPSGPKGTTPPHTRGPNFQVVLIQVTPKVHVDP
jgi:hypothetical protein